ncbi:peroxiredoxin [Propylenella binzhouense]|uniref:thioredoxin-dependent peroxiredoxin n=1 Tax=Propylenella binzhouense TaxID=2555902 RepID=A0A964T3E2_9HYPH|nr:peroxiredoxin [Propylenella binzhouense]MYZ47189.1 peroxiredoxin [Propylenella binzhouense]
MTTETTVSEGDAAPDFALATDGGGRFELAEQKGKPVVVYFYPKDDTSGCTLEAQAFSESKPEFDRLGVVLVGVSPDSAESHDKFKAKYDLKIALASDESKDMLNAYGVWKQKSMYGRTYMGVERSTFLIGKDGRIARIWRNVKVPGHVDEVLAAARAIA